MDVSIVVPTRGGASRLPRLFESFEWQRCSVEWEAIVVLDGDVDDSAAVVDQWSARLPVRAVTFPENRGRSAALNAGFAEAVGDVLVRCDDDLVAPPWYIDQRAVVHREQHAGVIGFCKNMFAETRYANLYGKPADAAIAQAVYSAAPDVVWRFWGGNVSVTRDVYERVGAYDTSFRAYGWEDIDWGYRLCAAGVPIVADDRVEMAHHGAAQDCQTRALRALYSGAARRRFEEKHGAVLPPTADSDGRWDRLVRRTAQHLDNERRVKRYGRVVDKSLPLLPSAVGTKAVALMVESAAVTGSGLELTGNV